MIAIVRVLLGVLVLFACQAIAGTIVPVKIAAPPGIFGWLLLSDAALVTGIGIALASSGWSKKILAVSTFVVLTAIALADLLEGAIFLKALMPWGRIALQVLITNAVAAVPLTLVLTIRRRAGAQSASIHRPWTGWVWRFVVADALYPVLYFVFGIMILPLIRDFYATQTVPSPGKIVALQFFVRGPVFVAVSLLLASMVQRGEARRAWLTGLCFALLSGVAPLILPNPFFPETVRYAHLFEVTTENFILAAFAGYLWYRRGHDTLQVAGVAG
jgi:hypothetical protein